VKVTERLEDLGPPPGGSVVSIGMFDGVHLGHRAILERNVARAAELGAVATAVTFRNHPKGLLLGHAPRTLTTLGHRLELFARLGIAHTLALEFSEELRGLDAAAFVERIAVQGLGVRSFVLGFDSKFGRDRGGTPATLEAAGFDVEVVDKVVVAGRAVSSTAIREAVELGDLESAGRMLGRRVSVFGEVVHGSQLGRKLGFPTANLDLQHELHPPPGVYACLVRWSGRPDAGERPAVANIGFRPTVSAASGDGPRVEVHVLDYQGDLYGAHLELEFVARLRGEERFDGVDALVEAIGRDVARARGILGVA